MFSNNPKGSRKGARKRTNKLMSDGVLLEWQHGERRGGFETQRERLSENVAVVVSAVIHIYRQ